jgi:hypothetical protein
MSLRRVSRSASIFWLIASIAGFSSRVLKSEISRVISSLVTAKDTSAKWFRVTGIPDSEASWMVIPPDREYSRAVNVGGLRTVMVSPTRPWKSCS